MAEAPLLRMALMKAMEGQGGDEPDGDESPTTETKPREPEEVDPRSQQDDQIFLDPALFEDGDKPKKGEEVLLRVKIVQPNGSKIVCEPIGIEGDEEEGEEGDEDEDEDEGPGDEAAPKDKKPDYMDQYEKD